MDLKIATALNLSPDLVWFNRQSFAEEMSSLSSDESDVFGQGRQSYYGGYFPEMPHDLGSDGTQSPGRGDTDDADSTGNDFSHALFAQEQMLLDGSFGKHHVNFTFQKLYFLRSTGTIIMELLEIEVPFVSLLFLREHAKCDNELDQMM